MWVGERPIGAFHVTAEEAEQLAEQGISSFADMAKLTDKKIGELAEAIPFSAEQITEWRDQAKELK